MQKLFEYTVFGIVLGGVYGIAASGLVLTYNTSGIFNFAHGAMAMLGAFLYWDLRVNLGWPAPIALFVVLFVIGPLMGGLLYVGIMRGLRNTAEVTKIVVTVSLTLGMLYLSQWVWSPLQPRTEGDFFGSHSGLQLPGFKLPTHEIIALVIAVLIAVGLRLLFYRTRTGVAMRGVVDDPELLELNGHSPERLAALSWAIGAFLAVLAGVLITPIGGGGLEANHLTLLVIDAFAAAIFGRLRSLPRTFVGALVLGLANNYVLAYSPTSWKWASEFRVALPMIVLFAVLVLLPQDRLRGTAILRTRERFFTPSVRSAVIAAGALVVGVALIRQLMVDSDITVLTIGMGFAVIALSLTLLTGYAGEMNLAAVSFGAIASIIAFHIATHGNAAGARMSLWGVLVAVVITGIVGVIVAIPAIRLRGVYMALSTMAFGQFLTVMVLQDGLPHTFPIFHWKYSFMDQGSLVMAPLKIGPFDMKNGTTFLMFNTVVFAVLGIAIVAVRNSSYGRRLTAMRDSPAAAATLGQNLRRLKLSVFGFSAAIAGLGGILMASALGSVTADHFSIFVSLALLMLTVVFGVSYVSGALLGGILSGVGFGVVVSTFHNLQQHHPAFSSPYAWLAHIAAVSPALIGIGLGRSPSGSVTDIVAGYRPLADARRILVGGAAVEALLYVLSLTHVIGHWWFAILTIVLVLVLPIFGQILAPEAYLDEEAVRAHRAKPPLDTIGIDRPFTDDDRASLDEALGV